MEPTSVTPVKITEQELANVTQIRNMFTDAQFAFGQFYLAKRQMDENERSLNEAYSKLQEDERKLLSEIVNKYGEGNLDPKTGMFTPTKK